MQDCVKGHVFAEVVHPATTTSLFYQIVFDNLLCPVPCSRVSEINHAELDRNALNKVGLVGTILNEIAISVTLSKLVLP